MLVHAEYFCRHVEEALDALRESVANKEDMDEDDLEDLVRPLHVFVFRGLKFNTRI